MSSAAASASAGGSSRAERDPARVEHGLRRVSRSCSAMNDDAERDEPVDQVQPRQLLAEQEQDGAVDRLDHDERLARAQQRPERAAQLAAVPAPRAQRPGREVDRDQRHAEHDVQRGHPSEP